MAYNKTVHFLCAFLLIKFSPISSQLNFENESINQTAKVASNRNSVTSILEFWREQSKKFRLGTEKNITVLLGITGSGKTTLGLLLTDDELMSIEIDGTGEYIFIDKSDRINRDSAITSKTIVPELMIDKESGTVYFDCPGFIDTRGIPYDLSVAYFIKKLLRFADSIKFVFVIASSSVRISGDRREFMELARYATTLIKDIEKFRTGIALVVTKVPNEPYSDQIFVNRTAHFLKQTKIDLIKRNNKTSIVNNDGDREFNEEAIKFIDILLENENTEYTRIGIFRLATANGSVRDMSVLQNEKKVISSIVNQNIQFIRKEDTDFKYTISSDSLNRIHELMRQSQQDLCTDLMNIDNELKKFYSQAEKTTIDLNQLHNMMIDGYQKYSQLQIVNTLEPKQFVTALLNVTKNLNVNNLKRFLEHFNAIDFLTTVGSLNQSESFRLTNQLENSGQFLDESQKWYGFLVQLNNILSEYRIQNNIAKYNVTTLLYQCRIGESEHKNVNETDLKAFLQSIGNEFSLGIENMVVNFVKMKTLHAVLSQTMQSKIYTSCSSSKFIVRGYNVKLSEVIASSCWLNATNNLIEIFALNKIFIDADIDKTGHKVELSIIAPIWEIITNGMSSSDKRKIILNGEDGTAFGTNAHSGSKNYKNGRNGAPGLPGGPAGRFFCIGSKFINDQRLNVYLIGGKGGPGQNGGRGFDGIDGENPPTEAENIVQKWRKDFVTNYWREIYFFSHYDMYRVKSKPATAPGRGGDGGECGFGGRAGKALIISTKQSPAFVLFSKDGSAGASGKGGQGGNPAEEKTYEFKFVSSQPILRRKRAVIFNLPFVDREPTIDRPKIKSIERGRYFPAGISGIDAGNSNGRKNPETIQFTNPSLIVNSYKSYSRENLQETNNINELNMKHFMDDLEQNTNIQNLYDTIGLIDDLQCIERQHSQLMTKSTLISTTESLTQRIETHLKARIESEQNRQSLNILYTAALGKLCTLKRPVNHVSVVDLLGFMDIVKNHIDKWNEATVEIRNINYLNEIKSDLNAKIETGNRFIDEKILPEMENIFTETDRQILRLIDETLERQYATEMEIAENKELEEKLKKAMMCQIILTPLKIVGSSLSFFGPIGSSVSAAMQGTTLIADQFLPNLNVPMNEQLSTMAFKFNATIIQVRNSFNQKQQLFEEQLNDIKHMLNGFVSGTNSTHFTEILQKVNNLKSELNKRNRNGITNPRDIQELRFEFKEFLTAKQQSITKKQESGDAKTIEKHIQMMNKCRSIVDLADVTISVYRQIRNNLDKIEQVHKIIERLENQLEVWKRHEQNIHDIMVPQLNAIQSTMQSTWQNLRGKSHIELDVTKWDIQSALRNVKVLFGKMSKEFGVEDDLKRCIEQLDEGVAIVIDTYNRIDSYGDHAKLASYISNGFSRELDNTIFTDPQLKSAILNLKRIIQQNLILQQYEMVLYALKQHQFPFASVQMIDFALHSNDSESLLRNAIERIDEFKEQIAITKKTIGKYDREVFSDVEFGRANHSLPFYVWKSDAFRNEIRKLLQGEEIIMKADIEKGLNMNAVKFNEIEIRFKVANQSVQFDLNNELRNFDVTMTMVGNNYYRCDRRRYRISVDDNIVIEYSLRLDSTGKFTKPNDVCEKIRRNDYFLSPYATWSIKLTNATSNFETLNKFANETIDLELTGHGQYFKNQGSLFAQEICNDRLDQFYDFDGTMFDENSFDPLNANGELIDLL